jgi:transcriptional regulator with XRE-family HTH domain
MENTQDDNSKMMIFLLKEIAKQKNITQEEIANKIGVHRQQINRFFKADNNPTLSMFISVAKALEVNFFFEDKEEKTDLNIAFNNAMELLGRRPDKLSKN